MKTCKLCGKEHDRRSEFCSLKCKNQYYYQNNKERLTEYRQEYYITHKEECDKRYLDWVRNNSEKWSEIMKKYNKKRKERKDDEFNNNSDNILCDTPNSFQNGE